MSQTIRRTRKNFPFSKAPSEPNLLHERRELERVVKYLQDELDALRIEIDNVNEGDDLTTEITNLRLRVISLETAVATLQAALAGLNLMFQPYDDDLQSI